MQTLLPKSVNTTLLFFSQLHFDRNRNAVLQQNPCRCVFLSFSISVILLFVYLNENFYKCHQPPFFSENLRLALLKKPQSWTTGHLVTDIFSKKLTVVLLTSPHWQCWWGKQETLIQLVNHHNTHLSLKVALITHILKHSFLTGRRSIKK